MGKLQTKLILAVALSLYVLFETVEGGVTDREAREYNVPDQQPRKRPFCNAFTGCGRKRSAPAAPENHDEGNDDTISTLVDLNSEPAVEDLMRQIMSEAKLFENIQEANRELYFQKNGRHQNHVPVAFSTQ